MHWDLILWLIAIISNIGLLVILIYQIICLSDLEADYMNPYESSTNINSMVIPEFLLQGAFCAIFLLTGHWFMFLITLPVAVYHARLFSRGEHLVDVTEIFRALSLEKKYRMIKLGMYLFFFFLVIVRLVIAIYNSLADEDEADSKIILPESEFSAEKQPVNGVKTLLPLKPICFRAVFQKCLSLSAWLYDLNCFS